MGARSLTNRYQPMNNETIPRDEGSRTLQSVMQSMMLPLNGYPIGFYFLRALHYATGYGSEDGWAIGFQRKDGKFFTEFSLNLDRLDESEVPVYVMDWESMLKIIDHELKLLIDEHPDRADEIRQFRDDLASGKMKPNL
jgi:hypothetical protein